MLLIGTDVSGRPGMGNDLFMSIVAGTENKISSMIRNIGNGKIHMHMLSRKTQNEIISKLKFNDSECIALCLKIDRTSIINDLTNRKKIKSSNILKSRIFTTFNYTLWSLVQDSVKEFLKKHNYDIHDVVFQCDHDSDTFVKTMGLRSSYKGHAYVLSDIVAWANNNGNEPHGVIHMDLTDNLTGILKNKICRRS